MIRGPPDSPLFPYPALSRSPGVDEELEHESQAMPKAGPAPRPGEGRECEPVAEGDPDITADPSGTLVGGVPVGMTEDAVVARAELARWLDRAEIGRAHV